MTLRTRITIATAAAVAIAVVLAAFAAYSATSSTLKDQIDQQLAHQAEAALHRFGPGGGPSGPQAGDYGGAGGAYQLVNSRGQTVDFNSNAEALPVATASTVVAQTGASSLYGNVTTSNGIDLRVLAVPVATGIALQVAQPLTQVDQTLANLRTELVIISLAGIALAAIAGAVVAASGIRPVTALAADVDHVARTGDLSHRIPVTGHDEPALLAHRFNDLLDGLEQARNAQDQLIADAAHELRTPLTALRANVELLASGAQLDPEDRRKLTEDLTVQLDGVGALIGDLVLLARGERTLVNPVPVQLDEVAEDAVARARAWWPDASITITAAPTRVIGDPDTLARAVGNLIDNGVKHGGGHVEVTVGDGQVAVRDHGPGIPDDVADQVFARFWRGPDARSRPGSGLGLAIVQQAAISHNGSVSVRRPEDGGAEFDLRIPVVPPDTPTPEAAV
jgi:two-component system sensor histidine kinase MprB